MTDESRRVLFLCTGNSARSQMAEALLGSMGGARFEVASAGSDPATRVHPLAIETLRAHGLPWDDRRPQHVDALSGEAWDFVITVCDRAREACPIFPGQPMVAHWGMADPAAVTGTDEEKRRAFTEAFLLLRRRLELFLALPAAKLDRLAMQHRLDAIGETNHPPAQ